MDCLCMAKREPGRQWSQSHEWIVPVRPGRRDPVNVYLRTSSRPEYSGLGNRGSACVLGFATNYVTMLERPVGVAQSCDATTRAELLADCQLRARRQLTAHEGWAPVRDPVGDPHLHHHWRPGARHTVATTRTLPSKYVPAADLASAVRALPVDSVSVGGTAADGTAGEAEPERTRRPRATRASGSRHRHHRRWLSMP